MPRPELYKSNNGHTLLLLHTVKNIIIAVGQGIVNSFSNLGDTILRDCLWYRLILR